MKTLKLLYLASLFFQNSIGFAQSNVTLKGLVTTRDKTPIPGAVVALEADSKKTLVKATMTNTDGTFEITGIPRATYLLTIQILGFKTIERKLSIEQFSDIGIIELDEDVKSLKEVTVTAAPIYLESNLGTPAIW